MCEEQRRQIANAVTVTVTQLMKTQGAINLMESVGRQTLDNAITLPPPPLLIVCLVMKFRFIYVYWNPLIELQTLQKKRNLKGMIFPQAQGK